MFKEWLKNKFNLVEKAELDKAINDRMDYLRSDKRLNELLQIELGSITIGDIDFFTKLDDTARREYVQAISAIWIDRLKPTFESFIEKQKDFIVKQALDNQIVFSKGSINGIFLLYNFFEQCHNEHKSNITPKEKFDKFNPLPE